MTMRAPFALGSTEEGWTLGFSGSPGHQAAAALWRAGTLVAVGDYKKEVGIRRGWYNLLLGETKTGSAMGSETLDHGKARKLVLG